MKLDFATIAKRPIMDMASKLGWQLTEMTTTLKTTGAVVPQFIGPCPISKKGGDKCFKITPSLNRFSCWCPACHTEQKPGGDIIELMRRLRGLDLKQMREAALEVETLFGAGKAGDNGSATAAEPAATARKSLDFDPLKFLADLDVEHDALEGLAVSSDTLRLLKAGFCTRQSLKGRLAVAIMNGETIQFFIGISLSDEPIKVPTGKTLPNWYIPPTLESGEVRVLQGIVPVIQAVDCGESNVICPLQVTTPAALRELADMLEARQCTLAW